MKLSVFLDKTKCKLLVTLDKTVFNNVPSKYDNGSGNLGNFMLFIYDYCFVMDSINILKVTLLRNLL